MRVQLLTAHGVLVIWMVTHSSTIRAQHMLDFGDQMGTTIQPLYKHSRVLYLSNIWCVYTRTSEAKDCSQNANLHRPLMDMGMLEKS
jgi:hypothetical protein